jgi:opacity protein-like surface antigen
LRLRTLLPTAVLLALPAAAQDAHVGLTLGLSLPQGDASTLVDSHTGFTLGLQAPVDLKNGHMVRPRLDYTQQNGSPYGIDITVSTLALGVDYNYYFSRQADRGFYLLAGLGYANTKVEVSSSFFGGGNDTEGAVNLAFGGGVQFNPTVGMEIRYTSTHPDFGGSLDNDALNLSVTFRF